jgi:predicted component of type VI protein secretion system
MEDAERLASAYLIDDRAKVAHTLAPPSTSIGRDASNEIVIRDPSASRFHAEIKQENDTFVLRSIGATGTLLNAKPLTGPHTLTEGDSVEIAFVRLRFARSIGAGISPAPPPSGLDDDFSRKPTYGADELMVVEDANLAGKDLRRVQIAAALFFVLIGLVWWAIHVS